MPQNLLDGGLISAVVALFSTLAGWLGKILWDHLQHKQEMEMANVGEEANVIRAKSESEQNYRRDLETKIARQEKRIDGLYVKVESYRRRYHELYVQNRFLRVTVRSLVEQNTLFRSQLSSQLGPDGVAALPEITDLTSILDMDEDLFDLGDEPSQDLSSDPDDD